MCHSSSSTNLHHADMFLNYHIYTVHVNSALNQSFKHALYVHVQLFGSTNEIHARIS